MLTVQWPNLFSYLETMQNKLLTDENGDGMKNYHPRFLGFEATLNQFRDHSTEKIESIALFPLSLPVQTPIEV